VKTKDNFQTKIYLLLAILSFASAWALPAKNHTELSLNLNKDLPAWPTFYQGKKLKHLPLSKREKSFLGNFPGKLARFSDGHRQIIMRWVTIPTRQLHPAIDCFRGLGFTISNIKISQDSNNHHWRKFTATLNTSKYTVREHIMDANNLVFTDTSSWYWQAMLNKSKGPWLAITIAKLQQPQE